jgi:hypothetical protein
MYQQQQQQQQQQKERLTGIATKRGTKSAFFGCSREYAC